MFRIQQEADKGFEARTFPIAPQFVEMLLSIPEDQRTGYVFNPLSKEGTRHNGEVISRLITRLGREAEIRVGGTDDKPKFASAHDFRRSFGTRWASKATPAILQQMMRHAEISTTMGFYVTQNAETMADAIWSAFGATSGTTAPENKKAARDCVVATPYG